MKACAIEKVIMYTELKVGLKGIGSLFKNVCF
jgi:hypothetical protein